MRFMICIIVIAMVCHIWAIEESSAEYTHDDTQTYSLEQLLDTALQQNTTLKQSILNVEKARLGLSSVRINYFPEISGSISRSENFDNIRFEGRQHINSMGFTISKNIALKNQSYFATKNAEHSLTLAEIAHEMQINNTIFEIIQNYINVLENQKRAALYEEDIKIQESIVAESNILFLQRKITQFQLQQSEINLLNSRISSLNAQNNLNDSRKRLFDLINITDETYPLDEVSIYDDVDSETITRDINFDQILRIRQQNESMNSLRTSITQTKMDFYPQMNLAYTYGRTLSSEDFSFDRGRNTHTISLNLSYSLNNLFRNRYTYKQARYTEEQQNLDTAQLIKDISQRFTQLIEELKYLEQLQTLQENRLLQTTANLEMAQQRYRLGLLTQLDLDKASYEYTQARIATENNHYAIIIKKLNIDNLLSNRLF